MGRRKRSRIYLKRGRAYGDFRDLGGRQEALIPIGEARATTDPDIANKLVSRRAEELETQRRNRALLGVERDAPLARFAQDHLVAKAKGRTGHWRSRVAVDGGEVDGTRWTIAGRSLLRPSRGCSPPV